MQTRCRSILSMFLNNGLSVNGHLSDKFMCILNAIPDLSCFRFAETQYSSLANSPARLRLLSITDLSKCTTISQRWYSHLINFWNTFIDWNINCMTLAHISSQMFCDCKSADINNVVKRYLRAVYCSETRLNWQLVALLRATANWQAMFPKTMIRSSWV